MGVSCYVCPPPPAGRAVEPFREETASVAFYNRPAPDGSRPGIFYVNLADMTQVQKPQVEAIAFHEGAPGHHFQIALAQELIRRPSVTPADAGCQALVCDADEFCCKWSWDGVCTIKAKELCDIPVHFAVDDMQIAEDMQVIVGHMVMQWLYENKPAVE